MSSAPQAWDYDLERNILKDGKSFMKKQDQREAEEEQEKKEKKEKLDRQVKALIESNRARDKILEAQIQLEKDQILEHKRILKAQRLENKRILEEQKLEKKRILEEQKLEKERILEEQRLQEERRKREEERRWRDEQAEERVRNAKAIQEQRRSDHENSEAETRREAQNKKERQLQKLYEQSRGYKQNAMADRANARNPRKESKDTFTREYLAQQESLKKSALTDPRPKALKLRDILHETAVKEQKALLSQQESRKTAANNARNARKNAGGHYFEDIEHFKKTYMGLRRPEGPLQVCTQCRRLIMV
jgi:hypothetical protein